ncbi:MAG TPA: serine/threonine-protein kinase [Gemmatimonadaceae bacterium]|nr:serine/threonine-protein kinase [Gemmatimonadaceae bacterium]
MTEPVASTADDELRAHIARVLGHHYDIERELGRGGGGIVYCARDRRLKRSVAIKLLPPELAFRSDIRSRFLREAETSAQLNHPNIVPIYAVDEVENLVFFVMAFVNGQNLARVLHDRGRLGVPETKRIVREVSEALAYAHARGVVHRDVKPDNVLLDSESGRAMVTDFGIARALSEGSDSRLTATGMAIGTPAYMSPEQAAGERDIDGRSDLYALGIVAYQMLTGAPPFSAPSTPAMLVKHLTERPQPVRAKRPDVPPELERIVMVLLEKDPANRLPDANALIAALDGARVAPPPPPTDVARIPTGASSSPAPAQASPPPFLYRTGAEPNAGDLARWNAPPVARFRKEIRRWGWATVGMFFFSLFANGFPWLLISGFWMMGLLWRFTSMMGRGADWRDVLRRPRDAQLVDVMAEWVEEAQSVFDRDKRAARRLARRGGADAPALPPPLRSPLPGTRHTDQTPSAPLADMPDGISGPRASVVAQARIDRDEIKRLIDAMSGAERSMVANVVPSADALYERVRALAMSVGDLERNLPQGTLDGVDAEIARLEAEANPLDRARSEERVRRLATLRRQRRALGELTTRRDQMATRLESCALALQSMRFDVLRLRAGAQSHAQVTSLALEAMSLAREVDYAVSASDDVARLTTASPRGSTGR